MFHLKGDSPTETNN